MDGSGLRLIAWRRGCRGAGGAQRGRRGGAWLARERWWGLLHVEKGVVGRWRGVCGGRCGVGPEGRELRSRLNLFGEPTRPPSGLAGGSDLGDSRYARGAPAPRSGAAAKRGWSFAAEASRRRWLAAEAGRSWLVRRRWAWRTRASLAADFFREPTRPPSGLAGGSDLGDSRYARGALHPASDRGGEASVASVGGRWSRGARARGSGVVGCLGYSAAREEGAGLAR